ncbi:MAG: hypothetical protein H0X25_05895 [Acidobacteriales bacterium]|nr:hypothetical protein [Terriglobales bacterium]
MKALARISFMLLLGCACSVAAGAQTSLPRYGTGQSYPNSSYPNPGTSSSTYPGSGTTTRQGRNGEPCWKQVGISQSVNQERKQIEETTRSQMESVCHNNSISTQQKQQEIQKLREQSRQKIQSLVGAQQEQALRACREQRGETGRAREKNENFCSK